MSPEMELCLDANGLALGGFDPVSYFDAGEPLRGRAENALIWRGGVFHFGELATQQRFLAAPERFLPQYGGYCALGMALERTDEADPAAWTIFHSRLYLFLNHAALSAWTLHAARCVARANERWACLTKTRR